MRRWHGRRCRRSRCSRPIDAAIDVSSNLRGECIPTCNVNSKHCLFNVCQACHKQCSARVVLVLVNTHTPACRSKLHEPSIGVVVHIGHPKSFMILVQYVHLTLLSHLALRGGCVGSSIGSGSSIATYTHNSVSVRQQRRLVFCGITTRKLDTKA